MTMTDDQAQSLLDRLHSVHPVMEEQPVGCDPELARQLEEMKARLHSVHPVMEEQPAAPSRQIQELKAQYENFLLSRSQTRSEGDINSAADCLLKTEFNIHEEQPLPPRTKKRRTPFSENNPLPGGFGARWRKQVKARRRAHFHSPAMKAKRKAGRDVFLHWKRIAKADAQLDKDVAIERGGGLIKRNERGKILYRTLSPERLRRSDRMRALRAQQLQADWARGERSTQRLTFVPYLKKRHPEYVFREKDSLLFVKLMQRSQIAGKNVDYYEHTDKPDLLYIDIHGECLPFVPDWRLCLEGQECLVELERATQTQELYYSWKKNNFLQYRKIRHELISTLLRYEINFLRHQHLNAPIPFLLARPDLKDALGLRSAEEPLISDATLFDHLNESTSRYINFTCDILERYFPEDYAFIKRCILELEECIDHPEDRPDHLELNEEFLLKLFHIIIKENREMGLTIDNIVNLHLRFHEQRFNRPDTRKIPPLKGRHLRFQ
jgi:hypothetical protein